MLAAGSTLGRYELVAPLGSGGMGSVWRARDSTLGRDVAVKVIAPNVHDRREAVARFRREAETASSLNHPALVTVFEVGSEGDTVFIAMQLVDGTNLREWLKSARPLSDVLDVLAQAAAGLAAAHDKGVLHRDVKPENIMVTPDGFAKVVDFGLAKLIAESGRVSADERTAEMITRGNVMVGTVPYMSPEQICGEELDPRSDVFSFGAVLYEAVTGKRPFPGRTTTEVVGQILKGDVQPLAGVDPELDQLIAGCLQRKREARIGSMRDVVSRLRTLTRASSSSRPRTRPLRIPVAAAVLSIAVAAALVATILQRRTSVSMPTAVAVLPFDTGDIRDAYLSSGFAEGVTTDLTKQPGLIVIARESATRFRSGVDVRTTAAELGARYLVLGNVARAGEKLRIDARLVDGASRAVVWAEKYDTTLRDVFSVQSRIARDVATKILPGNPSQRTADETPHDPAVADLYLRALFFASDPVWSVRDNSIPLLEQVCAADPQFKPARVHLAEQYARRAFARDPDRQWEQRAFVEVEKLLRDFPSDADAHRLRGNLRYSLGGGWRYDEALADYDRSIALHANNVRALESRGALMMHYGLLDEALVDFERVRRLDPFNDFVKVRIPRTLMYQGRYSEAIDAWRAAGYRKFEYAVTLEATGQTDEALKVAREAREKGFAEDPASALAVIYAHRGDRRAALAEIEHAERGAGSSHFHHAAYFIAVAHAQMGDVTSAVNWLERVAREGMPCHPLFVNDPLLEPIRQSPEFRAFLERSRADWERRRAARQPRSG